MPEDGAGSPAFIIFRRGKRRLPRYELKHEIQQAGRKATPLFEKPYLTLTLSLPLAGRRGDYIQKPVIAVLGVGRGMLPHKLKLEIHRHLKRVRAQT